MIAQRMAALSVIIVSALFVAGASAQPEATQEELTLSPYRLGAGRLSIAEQIARSERLAALAEKTGDLRRAARHYAIACNASARESRNAALLGTSCDRARALASAHDITDVKIQLLVTTGTVQAWNFNFAGAVRSLNEAIALGHGLDLSVPDHAPVVGAHHILGSTLVELGQFDAAAKSLTFARDQCRASGNAMCAAYADIWLCRLHTMLGDFGVARAACDAGAAEAGVDNDPLVAANLGWMRGMLEAALGRHAASLASLQEAWQAAETRDPSLRPILAPLIIDALIRLQRLDEAEHWQRELDRALADRRVPFYLGPQIAMRRGQLAALQGRLDDAEAAFAAGSRSIIHEMSIRGHLAVAQIARWRGNPAGARTALESAIAKIEAARTGVGGTALRTSYLTLHARAYGELVGARWDADGAASAAAALQTAEAGRARALLDSLASAQVAGATAPTLDARAIQALLGEDEVLVEYVSLEDRLFAFSVTAHQLRLTPLPNAGSAAELSRRVEFFRSLVQENQETALAPAARRLYDDLLGPALDPVAGTARTLIIAADGPLHRLPFDAIGDAPRVIDRWNVVTVPSASALASRRQAAAPARGALVVAASPSVTGLPPLRAAGDEAAAIRRRVGEVAELSGATVTEEQMVARGLDRFAVLHFASHAVLDEERPLRSALVLSPGASGSDGRWNAEEIYRTPLHADLVVLSACSTAAGAATPGEGVMSLARAFLHAGAGATLATLWDVPDAPGPAFADVLYRELAAGRPLGEASATVRRELRKRGAPPQVWAAYVLTGNPDATVSVATPLAPWTRAVEVSGGAALILLLVAVARFVRPDGRWSWQMPAAAGAAAAIITVALWQWPARSAAEEPWAGATRGGGDAAITPMVDQRQIAWAAVAGADEYTVEMFDAAGLPAGAPRTVTSPLAIPETFADGWIRIAAGRQGQAVAQSALVRFTAH